MAGERRGVGPPERHRLQREVPQVDGVGDVAQEPHRCRGHRPVDQRPGRAEDARQQEQHRRDRVEDVPEDALPRRQREQHPRAGQVRAGQRVDRERRAPAGGRRRGQRTHRRGDPGCVPFVHQQHRQRHPGPEPAQVVRQPETRDERVEQGGAAGQRGVRDPGHDEHRHHAEFDPQLPRQRPAGGTSQCQREQRQCPVPGKLRAQRPGLAEVGQQQTRLVDLGERVGGGRDLRRHLVAVHRQHHDGDQHPVRRQDPQCPVPQVPAGGRPVGVPGVPGRERPVEQEAGEDEEQRDPDVQSADQPADRSGEGEPRFVADVGHHHRHGGEPAVAVERGEPRPRRCGDRGGGPLRDRHRTATG